MQKLHLDRRLRLVEYFTLGFGTMIGVGWLIVIDDWLGRGGPGGATLGFLLGGVLLLPVALTYGRLVAAVPDAGAEVAYTEKVFPRPLSFATGWSMTLAYLIVCPWEAVAIGKLASWITPAVDTYRLYEIAGKPVYLPRMLLGLALTALIGWLNYRGIAFSAVFQNVCTFGLLAVFAIFASLGMWKGDLENMEPLFSHPGMAGAFVSTLLVLQVVPYFMTGFESISKASEEASAGFAADRFRSAILLAITVGTLFYVLVVLVVPMVYPWQELTKISFGTAVAFERAFDSKLIGRIIFAGAVLSLFKVFNGNFVAATRLIYGMAKRSMLRDGLAGVHARYLTPHIAVAIAATLTVLGALLGEAVLIPITEVGSLAVAIGWFASCLAYLLGAGWTGGLRPRSRDIWIARLGALVALALILMKLVPFVPGSLRLPEYVALAIWFAIGIALRGR